MLMPCLAAVVDFPTVCPSSVESSTPSDNSSLRIMGMLIELAEQTATKGTSLPTTGGNLLTVALSPNAVTYFLKIQFSVKIVFAKITLKILTYKSSTCGCNVTCTQSYWWDWSCTRSIGIVDNSVEALIEPLPKHDCRSSLVKGQHGTSDAHVHWDLSSHSSKPNHFFSSVGMKCGIIELLLPPKLINSNSDFFTLEVLKIVIKFL